MMFNEKEVRSLSPKEQWKERHNISLVKTLTGYSARGNDKFLVVGNGPTEEDAMVDWAIRSKNKDWREPETAVTTTEKP